jgi:hypothetical protein
MAYVDLNPVRAAIAETPEASDYSSIQQRSNAVRRCDEKPRPSLLPLGDAGNADAAEDDTVCRFRLMDYLELVDSTGRAVRDDKRGAISTQSARVLDRLAIDKTSLAGTHEAKKTSAADSYRVAR